MYRLGISIAVLLVTSTAAQQLPDATELDWWNIPGEWVVPYEIARSPFWDQCEKATTCTSFMADVYRKEPSCIRYLNPKVIYDGREIPGHVTETGIPGESDWRWTFQTDELFTGPLIWRVKTIDVCPKVG